jgi:hypothetical protein
MCARPESILLFVALGRCIELDPKFVRAYERLGDSLAVRPSAFRGRSTVPVAIARNVHSLVATRRL